MIGLLLSSISDPARIADVCSTAAPRSIFVPRRIACPRRYVGPDPIAVQRLTVYHR
jgi:hypothetical protein